MNDTVLVAVISFGGTTFGSILGVMAANKLTNYRIEQLEKKVDKHNRLVERMTLCEASVKSAHHRLDDLRDEIHGE